MMLPPWWTDADKAEFDLVVWEFVDGAWAHKLACATCQNDPCKRWCPDVRAALDLLLDWIDHRNLESLAIELRRLEQQALALEEDPERLARMQAEAALGRAKESTAAVRGN